MKYDEMPAFFPGGPPHVVSPVGERPLEMFRQRVYVPKVSQVCIFLYQRSVGGSAENITAGDKHSI